MLNKDYNIQGGNIRIKNSTIAQKAKIAPCFLFSFYGGYKLLLKSDGIATEAKRARRKFLLNKKPGLLQVLMHFVSFILQYKKSFVLTIS